MGVAGTVTQPALHAPRPPADAAEALVRVREHGGRLTSGKRALVALLYDGGPLLTADEIIDRLDGHDRSAVYRNLAQFEELGIVEHLHIGHGAAVYRPAGRPTIPVSCMECGTISELDRVRVAAFVDLVARDTGVTIDFTHFPLTGMCEACLTT